MKKDYAYIAIATLAFSTLSNAVHAQSYPNYGAYGTQSDNTIEKTPKTPPANFFPGGRSSTNFFEDKSVTPNLIGQDRKVSYGTDVFHNPSSAPAPTVVPEAVEVRQVERNKTGEESWSTDEGEETEEAKNLNKNIEEASEQLSDDPRVQDVLAQSRKIKEALFGKTSNSKTNDSKSTIVSKNSGKVTKEIERF